MDEDYNMKNLEKLIIEKSCKIGFLENENREKSLEISKLKKIIQKDLLKENCDNIDSIISKYGFKNNNDIEWIKSIN